MPWRKAEHPTAPQNPAGDGLGSSPGCLEASPRWQRGSFGQAQVAPGCQGHREKRSAISMETSRVRFWRSKWFFCPSRLLLCQATRRWRVPVSPGRAVRGQHPRDPGATIPCIPLRASPASPGPISPPSIPVPPRIPPRPPPRVPSRLIDSSPSQWTSVAAGGGAGGPRLQKGRERRGLSRGWTAAPPVPAAAPRPARPGRASTCPLRSSGKARRGWSRSHGTGTRFSVRSRRRRCRELLPGAASRGCRGQWPGAVP